MTQHRSLRPRRRVIAGVVVSVLLALTASAGPSFADDFDNQRAATEARQAAADRRKAELESSIEGLSDALGQAVLDLQATQARLPQAQAELATAQAELERSQREAALVAARLDDAKAQESAITATMETDAARGDEIRAAVGQLARRAYKGETAATSLSVVMDATSTEDFVDQYGMVSTALRTQTKALDELEQIEATNRNSKARLAAVKTKVAALKDEADAKVVEADTARAAAAARQAEIERLIVEQAAKQAEIAGMKAQAEAEQAEIDAERNTIAAELAEILAQQRAAAAAAGQPSPSGPSGSVSGAIFGNPTATSPMYVTSEWGMRFHPILHYVRLHAGIDLRTYCDRPIYAARGGTVLWAKSRTGFGNQILIDHGYVNGTSVMASYNHMSRFVVGAGQNVNQGQLIGYSGNTGTSAACHLHFEVYLNGNTTSTVNPRPLLGL